MPWNVGPPDTRIKLDDLATPDDNRDLNATILRHGLLPKLSGSASDVLRGDGQWGAPGAAGSLTSVIDALFTIIDDITPGKVAMFQCAGLTAGIHTYAPPPSTAGTTVTLAALELAQTFTQPQIIDPGAVGDVPLKLVGQAGQTADLFQVMDSTNAVLTNITAAGDIAGGVLVGYGLVLKSNTYTGGGATAGKIELLSTGGVKIKSAIGSPIDAFTFSVGSVSGSFDALGITFDLKNSTTNANSTLRIDNRTGLPTPVSLQIWRATIGSTANQTEWRDEANAIMSRIRSDGAFVGPIVAGATDVTDSTFRILDDATPTKIAQFQCSGLPVGTSTFSFPALSVAGTDTLASLGLAQTFTGALTLNPSAASAVPLKIVSDSNTSINAIQVRNSADTLNVFRVIGSGSTFISESGSLTISGSVAAGVNPLSLSKTVSNPVGVGSAAISASLTSTGMTSGAFALGGSFTVTADEDSPGETCSITGLDFTAIGGGSFALAEIVGISGSAQHAASGGTGLVVSVLGMRATVSTGAGASTMAAGTGLAVLFTNGGPTTDYTGVYIYGPSDSGSISNLKGLRIADMTYAGGSTRYAIFSEGGQSRHVGSFFVGGASDPTARMHLAAGTTAAATAPLKFNSGTSMTTAEAGAFEFTTDNLFFTITTGAARKRLIMADATAGLTSGKIPVATTNGRLTDLTASAAYTPTNVITDRSYDANATTLDELADVVGTIIADLQTKGILG